MAARWQSDCRAGKTLNSGRITQRSYGLFTCANFTAPCTLVGVGGAKLVADRLGSDAKTIQPHRIKFDPDFAVCPAVTIYAPDTRAALQAAGDFVIHKPRQFFNRHIGRRYCKGHDRLTFDINPGYYRGLDITRQAAADLVNRIFCVLHRFVCGDLHHKFSCRCGDAVCYRGCDVFHAIDTCKCIFDFLGNLCFEFCRGSAGLGNGHCHDRHINIWKPGDRHPIKRLPPKHHKHHKR